MAAGLTVTATAEQRLLPALHALDVQRDWILLDSASAGERWREKLRTYDDPQASELYLQQHEGTQGAQKEVLDLLLEHLPRRYPANFELRGAGTSGPFPPDAVIRVTCKGFDAEYRVGDYLDCPLRLASLLVQEDLVIMKNHKLAAGAVHYSFSNFGNRRFGLDLAQLHAAVPQYKEDLDRPVTRVFDRLKPEKPCWRTNWNLAWDQQLLVNPNRYPQRSRNLTESEREATLEELRARVRQLGIARASWLKVEYQTLRRLPEHSDCLLFTVRTFNDSLTMLEEKPAAARNLAANVRRLDKAAFAKYLGIDDDEIRRALLDYTDTIVAAAA